MKTENQIESSKRLLITSDNQIKSLSSIKQQHKSTLSSRTSDEIESHDDFDGYAIRNHQISVNEQLKMLSKSKSEVKLEYDLFGVNFPLISVLSKRNVLNNSDKFLRTLLKVNKKSMKKNAENFLIKNDTIPRYEIRTFYNNKLVNYGNDVKNIKGYKKFDTVKALEVASLSKKINKKMNCLFNSNLNCLFNHNTNWYNRNYLVQNHFDNYVRNSYRIQYFYKSDEFVNKIKRDIPNLKYGNNLRAFPEIVNVDKFTNRRIFKKKNPYKYEDFL